MSAEHWTILLVDDDPISLKVLRGLTGL